MENSPEVHLLRCGGLCKDRSISQESREMSWVKLGSVLGRFGQSRGTFIIITIAMSLWGNNLASLT